MNDKVFRSNFLSKFNFEILTKFIINFQLVSCLICSRIELLCLESFRVGRVHCQPELRGNISSYLTMLTRAEKFIENLKFPRALGRYYCQLGQMLKAETPY